MNGCFSCVVHKACKVKSGALVFLLVQEYSLQALREPCWVTRGQHTKKPEIKERQGNKTREEGGSKGGEIKDRDGSVPARRPSVQETIMQYNASTLTTSQGAADGFFSPSSLLFLC